MNSQETLIVDKVLYNAHVLTMDESFRQYNPGAVAIKDGRIVAVGNEAEIKSKYNASELMDCEGKILMPGLVNAHTHAPMSLLRGLADDLRLDVWLMGYIMPVEREYVSPDFVRLGTMLSCAEMIKSGTTCFADMYYFEDAIAETVAEIGMRGICGATVLKFPAPDAKYYEEALSNAQNFIKKWKGHNLIVPSIAPHAPYTTTPEILRACLELALEYDIPIQIHVSETSQEVENLRKEIGMPVVPYLKKNHLLNAKLIAAHCVYIDEGEMRALSNANAGVAHNPSSNMKLSSGIAPIKKMLDLHVKVGIGTDGPASNNDLDMFEEMRLASFLAKINTNDPTALPARQALYMATRGGASALHMEDKIGSISPNKYADLILLDISQTHNMPYFLRDKNNIYARIVYSAKSNDVTDVMVNGKWLMRNKKLITIDESAITAHALDYAKKIDAFLIQREKSVISKLIAIGGAMEEESFEVQIKVVIEDPKPIIDALKKPEITIQYEKIYRQYDTYFLFAGSSQGRLRYREDEQLNEEGDIIGARARLTLIGQDPIYPVQEQVLLSRSRYLAPATNSLRFYREYFKPTSEIEIQKVRRRYFIKYKNIDFYINIDNVVKPELGHFLEIKSTTWSKADAEQKANLVYEILNYLGASQCRIVTKDYLEIVLGL